MLIRRPAMGAGPLLSVVALLAIAASAVARPPAAEPFGSDDSRFGIGLPPSHYVPVDGSGPGMQSAADHIISYQCADGGWIWPHNACPGVTATNLPAPIGYGLLRVYEVTGDPAILDALVAAGDYSVLVQFPNGDAAFASFSPAFLHTLSGVTSDPSYSLHAATEFFDRLTAGTYGDPPSAFYPGDTYDYLDRHKALRAGGQINLRPWDMHLMPWVAGLIGNADSTTPADSVSQQDTFLNDAVIDGLNTLDSSLVWDLIGLAGGIRGLALNGTTTFAALTAPNFPEIQGIADLCDLADVLVSFQSADGSWSYISSLQDVPGEQDTQTTAYAVLALQAADAAGCTPLPGGRYNSEIAAGQAFLDSMQDVDGGFFTYPGSGEHNIEVDGEATLAAAGSALSLTTAACSTSGTVVVNIDMALQPDLIVGGQFFLEYDDSQLTFVSADPGGGTFTQEIFELVGSGTIAYAVGVPNGGAGTAGPETMATLTFTAPSDICTPTADLVTWDRSHVPPSRLTNEAGDEILPILIDLGPVAVDTEAPVITCPPDTSVECDEPVGPSVLFGTTGALTGGVAIYYNATGPADLTNASYLRTVVELGNLNGAEYFFDTADLTGVPGFTWQSLFSGLPPGMTQFGLDIVRPLPTDDSSIVIPPLDAVDNTDSTPGGAIVAGPVNWAINDYKPNSPNGPVTASNAPTNSIIRGPVGGLPTVDIEIVELSLTGATLDVRLKLDSDDLVHWFNPATPDTPEPVYGLNGDFYLEGTLTLADSAAGVDFFDGSMTLTANAPTATGFAIATDNCTLFPVITYSDSVGPGPCPQESIITRTWMAEDDCGNTSTCDQIITVVDTTPPVLADCPADITVNADAGGCDAVVTYTDPTATDNCDPSPVVACVPPSGSAFPPGPTVVTCTATDACGNESQCTFTVTVEGESDMMVAVELASVFEAGITRCITFELWECPGGAPDATVEADILFNSVSGTGTTGTATIEVPCGNYTCITARDTKHTLRRTDVDDFGISGTAYVADFTTLGFSDDDSLVGGNLNDDLFIDILDFGIFVGQYNDTPGADTLCGYVGPHADISGNGIVFGEDFTFITTNFLDSHEANCCGAPLALYPPNGGPGIAVAPRPVTRISVNRLRALGMDDLVVADLNHDGWLDVNDVTAFANGARP